MSNKRIHLIQYCHDIDIIRVLRNGSLSIVFFFDKFKVMKNKINTDLILVWPHIRKGTRCSSLERI